MKLIIGNKAYSSWSMRGWLACRLSGLDFEEVVVPLYDAEWETRRVAGELAPSAGKVPILWDGDTVVWDSLAIIEHLADKTSRDRFWPVDAGARGAARSMAAEMHSSFAALRRTLPMNVRRTVPAADHPAEVIADVTRIVSLWADARARRGAGGDFLFGDYGAVDIMFAPVVTRFLTYAIPLPRFAEQYCGAVLRHPAVRAWIEAAQDEPWVLAQYEPATTE